MIHLVSQGRPEESLQHHRRTLLKEISEWLKVSEDFVHDENKQYREELFSLLIKASPKHEQIQRVPNDIQSWKKLLAKWLKTNVAANMVKYREVYYFLAVDGLFGFEPNDLKNYFINVLDQMRSEYNSHLQGVRAIYERMGETESVSSLTGTDSGCVVLLTLLKLYLQHLTIPDDQRLTQLQEIRIWAEGFLHQHADYFTDVRNVNDSLLESMGKVYLKSFGDSEKWKLVGLEQTAKLTNGLGIGNIGKKDRTVTTTDYYRWYR